MGAWSRMPLNLPAFNPPLTYAHNMSDRWNNTIKPNYLEKTLTNTSHYLFKYPFTDKRNLDSASIENTKPTTNVSTASRGSKRWQQRYTGRAIVTSSTDPKHAASYACKFSDIVGPDWANVAEGKFCDNENNALYDICSSTAKSMCFDLEIRTLHGQHDETTLGLITVDGMLPLPPALKTFAKLEEFDS